MRSFLSFQEKSVLDIIAFPFEKGQQYCSTDKAADMCPPGYSFRRHTSGTQPVEELYAEPDGKKDDSWYADKCDQEEDGHQGKNLCPGK